MSRILYQTSRNFSSNRALFTSLSEPIKASGTSKYLENAVLWKRIFYFIALPTTGLCWLNIYLTEEPERPEFKKYEYLRIRRNKFPWRDGVKTLFHNPHANALPDGYEI